jgi:hypothetical protein
VVLVTVWAAFGQQKEKKEGSQRSAKSRQTQLEAVKIIQEQAAKLKADMEAPAAKPEGQELSAEEKAKLKESFTKMREERMKAVAVIEQQIAKLKGQRQLKTEHEESLSELQEIHKLAVKEKAEETAKRIMELIIKRNKEFEDTMTKLGFEQKP